jgi:hypothetical protein
MNNKTIDNAFVFIVGSPRSGTTILGEILDCHSRISQWYEPYFVWDHHFRNHPHDQRSEQDATPRVVKQVRSDFIRYLKKSGAALLVDKSPRNSLKIPFIKKIFPEAQFIHILRDGRDVTLSIHKEWLRRMGIVNDPLRRRHFNYRKAHEVIRSWLARQPFLTDRIRAFWFETHGHIIDKSKHLNRIRWNGAVGWGPRFKNWEHVFNEQAILEFNAHQWLKCVEAIHHTWDSIPPEKRLEIRYEDMVEGGSGVISKIVEFLGFEATDDFLASTPLLKKGNYNKWKKEFSKGQIDTIESILNPMLKTLHY